MEYWKSVERSYGQVGFQLHRRKDISKSSEQSCKGDHVLKRGRGKCRSESRTTNRDCGGSQKNQKCLAPRRVEC